jgi:hypothetical protein
MKFNIMEERLNIKLKNLLKKLFENKEFEYSFNDTSFDEIIIAEYTIEYRIEVGDVFGVGSDAVGFVDVIVDKILLNGEDFYYDWVDSEYGDVWYIDYLYHHLINGVFELFPFRIHIDIYGHDQ